MENLGSALRSARMRVGASQRRLARDAGVSNGTISLIENGKLDPTVGQLKKILAALNISMAAFFDQRTHTAERYFFRAADLSEIGSGPVSFRQAPTPLPNRRLQIMDEVYQPGADTGPSMLSHDGEEGGVVVDGEIEVQVLDRKSVLRAGDAYQFPSRLPHRFRNVGDTPCRIVSACTPPSF